MKAFAQSSTGRLCRLHGYVEATKDRMLEVVEGVTEALACAAKLAADAGVPLNPLSLARLALHSHTRAGTCLRRFASMGCSHADKLSYSCHHMHALIHTRAPLHVISGLCLYVFSQVRVCSHACILTSMLWDPDIRAVASPRHSLAQLHPIATNTFLNLLGLHIHLSRTACANCWVQSE